MIPFSDDPLLRLADHLLDHAHGRLDRLHLGTEGAGVVDYKTGQVAKESDMLRGEAVQLPFHALLDKQMPGL